MNYPAWTSFIRNPRPMPAMVASSTANGNHPARVLVIVVLAPLHRWGIRWWRGEPANLPDQTILTVAGSPQSFLQTVLQAVRLLFVLTILTGIVYPLVVTGVAQFAFPHQANGSLVRDGDHVIGSELLAQKFKEPRYFWPRPSAADYATVPSGASNQGPTSEDLRKAVSARRDLLGADAPDDLLTTSGSGLDPHLSPAAAGFQAPRIASARGVPVEQISALISAHTEGPQLGFLGEPRVNVLALNRALDQLH